MDKLYKDWNRIDSPSHLCNSAKSDRIESVWVNYELPPRPPLNVQADNSPKLLDQTSKRQRKNRNGKR